MLAAGAYWKVGRARPPSEIVTTCWVPVGVEATCAGLPANETVTPRLPVGTRFGMNRQPSTPVVSVNELVGWLGSTPVTVTSLTGCPTWSMTEMAAAPVPELLSVLSGWMTVSMISALRRS